MKDFYDIYYLSRTFDFEGIKLQTAIQETLRNRGTVYEKDSFERVLELVNDEDMHVKWRYFLKTLGNPEISFDEVIGGIKKFLLPIWMAIIGNTTTTRYWESKILNWQ
ncbi:MAG: nucleotidyl transferase AbiEii/AbiGii toxin family protein, partial [Clostridia bacterium]|nr:nucleotidyl transferase AbiEii/AbiGii toxin family protein [Clostridia bacterium]